MAHLGSSSRTRSRYLLVAALKPDTRKRYDNAVRDFLQWTKDNDDDAPTIEELDDLLMDYIHELYEQGHGKAKAINTLYGILSYFPSYKQHLAGSARAVKNYAKLAKGKSYPPLSWQLTMIIALQMARRGSLDMAVATLLGFDCLLRIGELTNICANDVADSADDRISREHKGMLIRLRRTKTGDNKWVEVLNDDVKFLMRRLLASHKSKPSAKLFNFTADKFRRTFKGVCLELGLSAMYVPHSLRHGGATYYHHVKKMSMEDVLMRGRWVSIESARTYVQAGVAVLLDFKIPTKLMELGSDLEKPGYLLKYLNIALSQTH